MKSDDTPNPELSVVIAVRDAASTLPTQMDLLVSESWDAPWEIVIADNGSTDATSEIVADYTRSSGRVRQVDASSVVGAAHARNVGAAAAVGRSLAFCDADDEIIPGWVAAMGTALRTHEFVTGPLELRALNPRWLADSRGTTGTTSAGVFEGCFPFASSCNLGISRDRFLQLRGFDERLLVGEDLDLSLRLHRLGVPLHFCPGAGIHYRYRSTLVANFRQARAYGAARPRILEELRRQGSPAPSRWSGARRWSWLVRHLPELCTLAGRARWTWVAGQQIGNLEGSWVVRRLYL